MASLFILVKGVLLPLLPSIQVTITHQMMHQQTKPTHHSTSQLTKFYLPLILCFKMHHFYKNCLHTIGLGEIAILPTYFVTVIIISHLVTWPNAIFLLAPFAISPKVFVTFLQSPKFFGHFIISPIFTTLFFLLPKSCSMPMSPKLFFILDKMSGQKTTKSPIFCLYHQNHVDKR